MNDSDLLISNNGGTFRIAVAGRANFEYAVRLRDIAKGPSAVNGVAFDLKNCVAMDSSFMGVLSMLALRLIREKKGQAELYNASENLQKLLGELGVLKLFSLKDGEIFETPGVSGVPAEKAGALDTARTVLEAHQTLVDAAPENEKKFSAVINYVSSDLERLEQENNKTK
jgi:hypothetical protein